MKQTLFLILLFAFPLLIMAQPKKQTVTGSSGENSIFIGTKPQSIFPPNLIGELNFADDNGDGVISALEKGKLALTIINKGKGPAYDVQIKLTDKITDGSFTYPKVSTLGEIPPGQSKYIVLELKADLNVREELHNITIDVLEKNGYDMDPASLELNTMAYLPTKIVCTGVEIYDKQEDGGINPDGILQKGERVRVKIQIQNTGGSDALETNYTITCNDPNIRLEETQGMLGVIKAGDKRDFFIFVSPNKRLTVTELPITMTVVEKYSKGNLKDFRLPIALDQRPPAIQEIVVNADIEKIKREGFRITTGDKFTINENIITNLYNVTPTKYKKPNSVALVIGVEDYEHLFPAPYATNDADIMKKYFEEVLGVEKVILFKNKEVQGFFFDNTFHPETGDLQKAITKGQTDLYVYYSGHGVPNKDGDKIYLFPADGKVPSLEKQGYNMSDFYTNLDQLGAKSVTVFLDACFSGVSRKSENLLAMKGVIVKATTAQPWETNPNFNVFTSSSLTETSLGYEAAKQGLFTYHLCVGLQGEADTNKDRKITFGEMETYLATKVNETAKKISSGTQNPAFLGQGKDKILVTY
jgi:hypothetical protein